MPNVLEVTPKGSNAMIRFDVGSAAWSPDYDVAKKLEIGKPLPKDWTVREGDYGPQAFPPKPKGGGATAWRNTKEGAEYENASRQRWQQVEEERKDRRTALMTAKDIAVVLESAGLRPTGSFDPGMPLILGFADTFYEWLRSPSAVGVSAAAEGPASSAQGQNAHQAGGTTSGGPAANAGQGKAGPPEHTSAAGADAASAGAGPPSTTDATVPASRPYPMSEADCDHKGPSGKWLPRRQIDGAPRCPRCGTVAAKYLEAA